MLYVSTETVKPKRIQGAYVSEKEVKRVVNYIVSKQGNLEPKTGIETELVQELEKSSEEAESKFKNIYSQEDPLYEEAKRVVIETRRASASLLQRRLRIGYARAARLIDILEEKGIVGSADGAKPREVYGDIPAAEGDQPEAPEDEEGWKKI
jgi:S-DNA-T family DNA segregation ATPase FtsK/SpoIIIE